MRRLDWRHPLEGFISVAVLRLKEGASLSSFNRVFGCK